MSAYPSLLSPLMDTTGLIATAALNTLAQTALAAGTYASAEVDVLKITALQEDAGIYTGLAGANMVIDGSIECTTLKYTTLDPPIAPGSSQTLAQVLATGNDGGNLSMVNIENAFINNTLGTNTNQSRNFNILNNAGSGYHVMTANVAGIDLNTKWTSDGLILHKVSTGSDITIQNDVNNLVTLGTATGFANLKVENAYVNSTLSSLTSQGTYFNVLNNTGSGYHNIVANASGLDLNTKWTSDGLILHKVSTGSDITIQNDVNNLITLGTSTGFADLQVGTLKYTALDPPVSGGGWVGTATSILDMSDYAIQNTPSVGFKNGVYTGIVSMTPSGKIDFETMGITNITDINCDSVNATGDITCNQLNYTTLNPPIAPSATPTLSDVLTAGNSASTNINMNTNMIYNASTLRGDFIHAITKVITPLLSNNGQDPTVKLGCVLDADNFDIRNVNSMSCGSLSVNSKSVTATVRPTYDYFVAKGGSDSSGTGSQTDPWLTIGRAIFICELQTDGVPRVVHVASGTYTENLVFSKSRISIVGGGVGTHPDVGSSISGTVTINLASGNSDLHNNNITLSGFLINGLIEDSTVGNFPHRVIITNCHLYANDRVLYIHPVYDYRGFVSNCVISNESLVATDPLVQCAGLGMVSFTQNQMTAKGASQMVFKLSVDCKIDVFVQNILTSASIGTNVAVAIFNHNSSQRITLGQNAFVYSDTGAKRNSDTAAGVFLDSTGSLVLLSNTFSLSGLASSQMAVYATSLSFPTTIIIYGANISTSNPLALTATGISGSQGTTKVATLSVQ
jgi:hypothetical protein